jgi:hypothetical protein
MKGDIHMRKLVMVLCLLLLTGFAYAQTETIYEEPMSATDVVSSGPAERIEIWTSPIKTLFSL